MQRLKKRTFTVKRIYFLSPKLGNFFYLRILLLYIRGPINDKKLYTNKKGQGFYITPDNKFDFKAAYYYRGFYNNNNKYNAVLTKTKTINIPVIIRYLFVFI